MRVRTSTALTSRGRDGWDGPPAPPSHGGYAVHRRRQLNRNLESSAFDGDFSFSSAASHAWPNGLVRVFVDLWGTHSRHDKQTDAGKDLFLPQPWPKSGCTARTSLLPLCETEISPPAVQPISMVLIRFGPGAQLGGINPGAMPARSFFFLLILRPGSCALLVKFRPNSDIVEPVFLGFGWCRQQWPSGCLLTHVRTSTKGFAAEQVRRQQASNACIVPHQHLPAERDCTPEAADSTQDEQRSHYLGSSRITQYFKSPSWRLQAASSGIQILLACAPSLLNRSLRRRGRSRTFITAAVEFSSDFAHCGGNEVGQSSLVGRPIILRMTQLVN